MYAPEWWQPINQAAPPPDPMPPSIDPGNYVMGGGMMGGGMPTQMGNANPGTFQMPGLNYGGMANGALYSAAGRMVGNAILPGYGGLLGSAAGRSYGTDSGWKGTAGGVAGGLLGNALLPGVGGALGGMAGNYLANRLGNQSFQGSGAFTPGWIGGKNPSTLDKGPMGLGSYDRADYSPHVGGSFGPDGQRATSMGTYLGSGGFVTGTMDMGGMGDIPGDFLPSVQSGVKPGGYIQQR